MIIPEGMPADEYVSTFIYEKDGVQQEFSLEEAPMNDSTWVFVDAKTTVVKKGYEPPIHDFSLVNAEGIDITEEVLHDTNYTFLLVSPKLGKADDSNVDRINEIYDYSLEHGYKFYCMTASTADETTEWVNNTGAEYPICATDEITLKTIVRSNPGLVLIKEGVIYNKWHNSNIPENKDLEEPLESSSLGQIAPDNDTKELLVISLVFLIPLALLYLADHKTRKQLKEKNQQL